MEMIKGNLYDYPVYYDLVFGSDWKAERDFLTACFSEYGIPPTGRLFEPACGTGRLMFRLARRGYDVSGLDLNARAVEYCNRRLERHGFPPSAFVGDMADFRLRRKVDAAFNMINSFRHLPSDKAARAHLQCMAAAVRRGGIYVLGLHLTPVAGAACDEEAWSARRGNLVVNTYLKTTDRDLRRRQERCWMRCDVHMPTRSFRIDDELVFRTYTWSQFRRLLDTVGEFELAATYDFTYDRKRPVCVDDTTEDVVFVLRRC